MSASSGDSSREPPRAGPAAPDPSPAAPWDGRSYGGSYGHTIFLWAIRLLGRWPAYVLLAFVVPYYCLIARKGVRASRAYLDRLLGPASFPVRAVRTYRHFFTFGRVLIDRFVFHVYGDRAFRYPPSRWDLIEGALAEGKGAIFVSAHVGAWEIAAAIRRRFQRHQLPTKLNVVMHLADGEAAPSFVERLEREGDLKVIPVRDAAALPFEVLGALERGEIVALHGDRLVSDSAVTVDFLGGPARFPVGPWQIAAATGAPVVQTYLLKEPRSQYAFVVLPPVHVTLVRPRSERQAELAAYVQAYARELEALLRTHPYQWFNFYDFWTAA